LEGGGIKLNPGVSIKNIEALELHFGFQFDKDFKIYLEKVNGFDDLDSDDSWFSFWSENRMREENQDNTHPQDAIWFSDYFINLCFFGFHKTDRKVYTHYQALAVFECVADSFSEFIDLYLKDPNLLLR